MKRKSDEVVMVTYFSKGGPANTERTLEIARERAKQLGIKDIVVASTHGGTALKAAKLFKEMKVNIVAVTISKAFSKEGWVMRDEKRKRLEAEGVKVLTCSHALGDGVAASLAEKHGGISMEQIVTQTLYRFSQGMKVCVEIVLMAADAGLIDVEKEVISIAGSGEGADTAIVVKPAYPRNFYELEIREIIAKPRHP
ncbi:MAG: pyruvate kinase alpha/beta domain-containing protein [Thermoproteota archaeon]